MKKAGVGIIGGSGYGAGELLRLLAVHPEAEVVSVASHSHVGVPISDLHPHLSGFYQLKCEDEINLPALDGYAEKVVFSALPHGVSSKIISDLVKRDSTLRIIDLSGDFRLADLAQHAKFYPESSACPEIRSNFTYGLPEVSGQQKIAQSRYIANPGCYATACILAVAPLIRHFKAQVCFDAKSGTSGAGRNPAAATHHPDMHSNFTAYKVLQHRHEPEIQQIIGDDLECSFVPHLIPVTRGIFVTAHIMLEEAPSEDAVKELYYDFCNKHTFVRFRSTPPRLVDVVTSNFCDLAVVCRSRRIIAMSAIDNLVKGMAGQAIQNMNLMCGFEESLGLMFAPAGLI